MGKMTAATQVANLSDQKYFIQEHSQSNLKGLLWGTTGSMLTVGSLGLTAATVAAVVASIFAAVTGATSLVDNFVGGPIAGPVLLGGAAAMVLVDYVALKFNGYCFRNSVYHFGPSCQIVKLK